MIDCVATVLKTGGRYTQAWVERLYRQVRKHWPDDRPLRFVCLSDAVLRIPGVEWRPLWHGWPGWWSKIELFRSDQFGEAVLYLDLDTMVLRPLWPLLDPGPGLTMLRDFYRPDGLQSAVMAWDAPFSAVHGAAMYRHMLKHGNATMDLHKIGGDQAFMESSLAYVSVRRWQNVLPGAVRSFKVDWHQGDDTVLLCFHGEPKQDNVSNRDLRLLWQGADVPS